jgi:predicted glutamine amidotransferase
VCRLFGMTSGGRRSKATFWLLEAPDSLEEQSRRNPDGTGLGVFRKDGTPELRRQPLAAFEDAAFVREAMHAESTTFVAHVRFATNGADETRNTHPFEMSGRLFAHNGVIGDVDQLEAHLGVDLSRVAGDTDSERYFALITRETEKAGGDVAAGVSAAAGWIAATLPVWSINFVLITPSDLWAFRYPETRELHVLERSAGGPHGGRHLDLASTQHTVRVRSEHLKDLPAVVVASEPMDENPAWRLLEAGELLHVGPDLAVTSSIVVDHPPAQRLELDTAEEAGPAPPARPERLAGRPGRTARTARAPGWTAGSDRPAG